MTHHLPPQNNAPPQPGSPPGTVTPCAGARKPGAPSLRASGAPGKPQTNQHTTFNREGQHTCSTTQTTAPHLHDSPGVDRPVDSPTSGTTSNEWHVISAHLISPLKNIIAVQPLPQLILLQALFLELAHDVDASLNCQIINTILQDKLLQAIDNLTLHPKECTFNLPTKKEPAQHD